jgi:hypothetical protein
MTLAASAFFGCSGTILIYFSSFSLIPAPIGYNMDNVPPELIKKNRRMQLGQHLGLALICISFAIQGVAAFMP